MTVCFCTLAIHEPYRKRARLLCADAASMPFVVLTDEPSDFADLPIRAIRHSPTGPMAVDYLRCPELTGGNGAATAYHDKRFALRAALEVFDTAIFVDADSRMGAPFPMAAFPPGLAVRPGVPESIAAHLKTYGAGRLPAFVELARRLTGGAEVLDTAVWCCETCYAVTRDGRESSFFAAWDVAVDFLQSRGVHSGEGGAMGLAAACAGWTVDFQALAQIAVCIQHEGGGPKGA
jgi:hypothetical protein